MASRQAGQTDSDMFERVFVSFDFTKLLTVREILTEEEEIIACLV